MKLSKKNLLYYLIASLLVSFSAGASAIGNTSANFQTYWHQFRTATLTNDYATFANFTRFPLPVKGRFTVTYQASEITKIFPRLMAQTIYQYQGGNLTKTTLLEAIKTKEKINYDAKDKIIRVDQFEFKFIDGKWFLTKAYLEE